MGKALLALRPGYERLIDELIDYSEASLCAPDKPTAFWMCSTQTAIRERLGERGYSIASSWRMKVYDYAKGAISYSLPEDYRFLDNARETVDLVKLYRCTWRGFDHGDTPDDNVDDKAHSAAAPHLRSELPVIVVNDADDYVCYAGMWAVERIGLAYLEPLCTVPDCRKKGIAAAALAELQRRTSALGCTHLTGGSNEFYTRLGFDVAYVEEIWEKGL